MNASPAQDVLSGLPADTTTVDTEVEVLKSTALADRVVKSLKLDEDPEFNTFLRGNALGNLWAVSYSLHNNLVLDAGFDHGLTKTSTRWQGFVGFTYLLPHRLWK